MLGIIIFSILLISGFVFLLFNVYFGRDSRGFNNEGIHKNGTKFDKFGYDVRGYDKDGYDKNGFDKNGYSAAGFDIEGYKIDGRDANGKFNRLHDKLSYINSRYNKEGFLNPLVYPVTLTEHVRKRICERVLVSHNLDVDKFVMDAYAYGKSTCQLMKTSSMILRETETRQESENKKIIALIYSGYIFIFTEDNVLITMYKNEKIII